MREFELALHHNVATLRKKRLIVLMMMDGPLTAIESFESEALKLYIRQYTYIDYKAKDWFNRLVYALPVNGMKQHTGCAAVDETTQLLQQNN